MERSEFKVLAIDDNLDNLIIVKALMRETFPEARVITTLSGIEGLELATTHNPDIILLDIVMPVMDGFEVCKKLKSDPELVDIPVVFVTALKSDKESRIKGLEVGAEAFLAKPIDKTELVAQIKAMLKIRMANKSKKSENIHLAALVSDRTRELEKNNMATLNLLEDLRQEIEARRKTEDALRDSQNELKKFAAHLQNIREEERILLSREIHDELGQILVAIKIDLGLLTQKAMKSVKPEHLEEFKGQIMKLAGLVNDTIDSSRRIMTDLRPVVLDFLGFIEAGKQHLNKFSERHQIECDFINNSKDIEFDMQYSVALFRILQESLNNIAKHADASHVKVELGIDKGKFFLEIADNGVGFDLDKRFRADSYGLIGMKERAFLLGGNFSIDSLPGKGTIIRVDVPLKN